MAVVGISAIQPSSDQVSVVGPSAIQSQQALTSSALAAAQSSTSPTAAQGHHHHHHHGGGAAAMNAASQLLGMSPSDLASALQSGQSLASVASSQGVSQSALVSAMATALQGSNSNFTASQASQLATQMLSANPGTQNQPWGASAQPTAASTFSVGA
jgi:preprotein translocase subunit SecD